MTGSIKLKGLRRVASTQMYYFLLRNSTEQETNAMLHNGVLMTGLLITNKRFFPVNN